MKTQLYNVDKSNKYLLKIVQVNNIEDASDDVCTSEEIDEMLGLPPNERGCGYSGTTVREKEIKAALRILKKELIKSGKKSIIIEDNDLVEALKDESYYIRPVGEYVDGLRRVGNRLMIHVKPQEKTVPMKRDHQVLMNHAIWSVNDRYRVGTKKNWDGSIGNTTIMFDIKYAFENKQASLELIKKVISWEEISFHESITDVSKDRMKQLWDNPAYFNDVDKSAE